MFKKFTVISKIKKIRKLECALFAFTARQLGSAYDLLQIRKPLSCYTYSHYKKAKENDKRISKISGGNFSTQ